MKNTLTIGTMLICFLTALAVGAALAGEGHDDAHPNEKIPESFFENGSEQNGRNIFFAGMTLDGKRIRLEGGPHWLYMHGGGCANCHGGNGQGGFIPMMCNKQTPPITLKALLSGEHEHEGESEKHTPYTLQTLRRALESSVNPAGKPLDPCMPRWHLTDDEYRDLILYLNSLPR